jgi:adenylate kinase
VLLIGPPGVGKGTQAKALMAEFGVPQISTGDLLRDHRARHTKLGIEADELMSRGQLVRDDLVNEMVATRLQDSDCANGYILDGFPRTLAQARWLDGYLAETQSHYPVVVISLEVERDDLLRRITGRRICPEGHIYNIYSQPPGREGVCDIDGKALQQRKDDTEAVFNERMKVFDDETAPVIPHYQSQGRFAVVNGLQDVDAVTCAIRHKLQELRAQSNDPTAGV